ncbi:MAG: nitroreductase family protein [Candidatus Freyarchaeota archaeon]|nr:nitroreductase family protein [Candidatus Freyrarchaeum guaymaensis]
MLLWEVDFMEKKYGKPSENRCSNIHDVIRLRRSIRRYTGERIPDEDLEKILDAARYTPSPENMQMYRFVVVRDDQETKDLIADLAKEAAKETFGTFPAELTQGRIWYVPPERRPWTFTEMRDGSLFDYPRYADVVIVACASESFHDAPTIYPLKFFGAICVGMAIISMWMMATALGYGAGYQAFPIMDPRREEIIADRLGIPRSWHILATLSIGVRAEERMIGPSRIPLEGLFYKERWGNPYIRKAFLEE